MVFTGTYEHAIDAKNRVAIPAEIRTLVQARRSDTAVLYVTLGEGNALCLYTEAGFEARAAELLGSDGDKDQVLMYERVWFSLARRVELDSAGRVRLPESLLKRAGLKAEVVLLGVNDHLEIRDRTAWYAYLQQALAEQPSLLMNPRRVGSAAAR